MLVLSRQRDETIMIGDNVEITIVDIRGDKVRLGISAPTTVAVHRKEVYLAIQRENEEAARLLDGLDGSDLAPMIPKAGEAKRLAERARALAASASPTKTQPLEDQRTGGADAGRIPAAPDPAARNAG